MARSFFARADPSISGVSAGRFGFADGEQKIVVPIILPDCPGV
jgi:hypothetical protein